MNRKLTILLLLFSVYVFAQEELSVKPYLDKIEKGEINAVKQNISELEKLYPGTPQVTFLKAVTENDGKRASELYLSVLNSGTTDKELILETYYRLFQYYYATGEYRQSDNYANLIINKYPNSKYAALFTGKRPPEEKPAEKLTPKNETLNTEKPGAKSKAGTETGSIRKNRLPESYTVQLGAFIEQRNAQLLSERVREFGQAVITERDKNGRIFYFVTIGSFTDIKEANQLLEKIRQSKKINGEIVTER